MDFTKIGVRSYMVAIIDIGSNTIRLCVYEIGADGGIRQTYKLKDVVGLAGYIDEKNHLARGGVAEACASLLRFRETLSRMADIAETHVLAAAALRNIANTSQVIKAIKRETGYDVNVISGEEEAICDYMGATIRTPMTDGLLVDIGGGSTELVQFRDGAPEQVVSVSIGSLSMFSRYVTRVLPTRPQAEKIRLEAAGKLETINSRPVKTMYGVGGIMRSLYKLNNAVFGEPPDNRAVSAQNAKKLMRLIDTDNHMMVGKILNICPERIHTITPGFIILGEIIKKYLCKTIIISESGVREGYLIRNVIKKLRTPNPTLPFQSARPR
jgi:exopolyphosphatase/guanosine-5'-triphosphate,3'-diphosphate pyrophosphatase